jgi:hypothetical protein
MKPITLTRLEITALESALDTILPEGEKLVSWDERRDIGAGLGRIIRKVRRAGG